MKAGAAILNDVSAGRDDSEMLMLAAKFGAPMVLMHMQGTPQTMQLKPSYQDVVSEVSAFLNQRVEQAISSGVLQQQIILDPGIGFGKTAEHNLELLAHLDRIVAIGLPVLLGTSRKRFLGDICCRHRSPGSDPSHLVAATCATSAWGVSQGVSIFRVHDVPDNRHAVDATWAITSRR